MAGWYGSGPSHALCWFLVFSIAYKGLAFFMEVLHFPDSVVSKPTGKGTKGPFPKQTL